MTGEPLGEPPTPAPPVAGPRTLAIDIGGSHLKVGLLAEDGSLVGQEVRVATPLPATPRAILAELAAMAAPMLDQADRVSAGFPGVVRGGVVLTAPNLGTPAWHGFGIARELTRSFGKPARVLNDASVQGLGVIAGQGLECVITLGTGMGFALFQDGRLAPHMELSQHPVHKGKIYDEWIGNAAREKAGNKRWNKQVAKAIDILRVLMNFDTLLIGGGNGKYLHLELPPDVRIVPNKAGVTGGARLWDAALDQEFAASPPRQPGPPAG